MFGMADVGVGVWALARLGSVLWPVAQRRRPFTEVAITCRVSWGDSRNYDGSGVNGVNNAAKIVVSTNPKKILVSWRLSEATPPPTSVSSCPREPEGMSEPHSNQTKLLIGVSVIAVIAAITFGGLWLSERERNAYDAVWGKPAVRKVLKEVEVPAELTYSQRTAINFTDHYQSARPIKAQDETLYKLDSVRVNVSINEAVEKVVSDDRIRNKFELILRKHGIKIAEKALVSVDLTIHGLWSGDNPGVGFLAYAQRIGLNQWLVVERRGDFRRAVAQLWKQEIIGFTNNQKAEGQILDGVESIAEAFANKYLAAQQKDDFRPSSAAATSL